MTVNLIINRPSLLRRGYKVLEGKTLLASVQTKGQFTSKGIVAMKNHGWIFIKNSFSRDVKVNDPESGQMFIFKADRLRRSGSIRLYNELCFYQVNIDRNTSRKIIKPVIHQWFNEDKELVLEIRFKGLGHQVGTANIFLDDKGAYCKNLLLVLLTIFKFSEEARSSSS